MDLPKDVHQEIHNYDDFLSFILPSFPSTAYLEKKILFNFLSGFLTLPDILKYTILSNNQIHGFVYGFKNDKIVFLTKFHYGKPDGYYQYWYPDGQSGAFQFIPN